MAAKLPLRRSLTRVRHTNRFAHIVQEDGPGQRRAHLNVRQTLADAATGPYAEGAEGALGPGKVGLCGLGAVQRALGADGPALGDVLEGLGVVVLVVVDGVVRDADDGALGDEVAVDGHAPGLDLAGQDAADRGGQAHGLVDAGAQVVARVEGGALDNVLDVVEGGPDLLDDLAQGVLVADEVEDGGGHGGGSGVGAGDNAAHYISTSFFS